MKADELIKKILNKEIVSGTGIRVITPTYSTEYYFWGNWFGTKDGDKPLDNMELHLCDSQVTFEIIEERPKEIEEEHDFYSYADYSQNKYEVDKILYIIRAINKLEEKYSDVAKIINYLLKKEDEKK